MVTKQSHTGFVVGVIGKVLTIAPLSSGRGFKVGGDILFEMVH